MRDNQAGTLELVAIQISSLFAPIRAELAGGRAIDLFAELGIQFPGDLLEDAAFNTSLNDALSPLVNLPRLVDALLELSSGGDFLAAIEKFDEVRVGIEAAQNAMSSVSAALDSAAAAGSTPGFTGSEVSAFTDGLASRLFSWSAITHLESASPLLTSIMDFLGVVERVEQQIGSTDPKYPQFTKKTFHFDRLPGAVFSPFDEMKSLYGFGESGFDGLALMARLESILARAGFPVLNEPGASPPQLDMLFAVLKAGTSGTTPGLTLELKTRFNEEFVVENDPVTLTATARLIVPVGASLNLEPDLSMSLTGPALSSAEGELRLRATVAKPEPPIVLIGRAEGSRLELGQTELDVGTSLIWDGGAGEAKGEFSAFLGMEEIHLVIGAPEGDGFLSKLLPGDGIDSTFDIGMRITPNGVVFSGRASLEIVIPLHIDSGIAAVDSVTLGVALAGEGLSLSLGAAVRGHLGPVEASLEGIGVKADFEVPPGGGNLGPLDVRVGFKPPTGAGISLEAGGVSGGGFLSIGENRYAGVLELSVYSVSVKAFGLIETVLPDGTEGFSFVIVISAEFTPIQLGFGFTLLGVGGLVGVNRTINTGALSDAARTGALAHLLFPRNLVQNAQAIIHDLATVFPAAKQHYIFGPMAKLGWGTPTLISADLGIILELPGPRLALLGVVRMQLPSPDAALLSLQMSVLGLLDFPGKLISIDAGLFDSAVVGFPLTGDTAFRLGFGNNARFLMSVGGFNPGFAPPPAFPDLRALSISLGVNGNPSLVASGYFALTSNTAQAGSSVELRASGYGIKLHGWFGWDVLIVFSPFSFAASISAGMRVSFHGAGIGITLRGDLSGPTPWIIKGKVCVSVLFWDACLPVKVTFGKKQPVSLPEMDPWDGDESLDVRGLQQAVEDPRSWAGGSPPAGYSVVTLAEGSTKGRLPIDPLGPATLRQRVAPLNMELEKFGEYQPIEHDRFNEVQVKLNGSPDPVDLAEITPIEDEFAPAHFLKLSKSERLSMPSYLPMDAGFSIAPNRVSVGSVGSQVLEYETAYVNAAGERSGPQPGHRLSEEQLIGQLKRCATALGGIRSSAERKYIVTNKPKKVSLGSPQFVVVDACSMARIDSITPGNVSHFKAILALRKHVRENPSDRRRYSVAPSYQAA